MIHLTFQTIRPSKTDGMSLTMPWHPILAKENDMAHRSFNPAAESLIGTPPSTLRMAGFRDLVGQKFIAYQGKRGTSLDLHTVRPGKEARTRNNSPCFSPDRQALTPEFMKSTTRFPAASPSSWNRLAAARRPAWAPSTAPNSAFLYEPPDAPASEV